MMKTLCSLVVIGVLAALSGCADAVVMAGTAPPQITGLQKVQIQNSAGQPLTGVTVQMTLNAGDGSEPVNTVGVSNERGRLDLPKSPAATYYFNSTGYAALTVNGKDVFGKTPAASPNYTMQGAVLVVTMRSGDAAQLFDANQLWQQGVAEPIKNMSFGPDDAPAAP